MTHETPDLFLLQGAIVRICRRLPCHRHCPTAEAIADVALCLRRLLRDAPVHPERRPPWRRHDAPRAERRRMGLRQLSLFGATV